MRSWAGREDSPELRGEIERKVISIMQKARVKGLIPREFKAFRFEVKPRTNKEEDRANLCFFPMDEYTDEALHQVWYLTENVDDPKRFKN